MKAENILMQVLVDASEKNGELAINGLYKIIDMQLLRGAINEKKAKKLKKKASDDLHIFYMDRFHNA